LAPQLPLHQDRVLQYCPLYECLILGFMNTDSKPIHEGMLKLNVDLGQWRHKGSLTYCSIHRWNLQREVQFANYIQRGRNARLRCADGNLSVRCCMRRVFFVCVENIAFLFAKSKSIICFVCARARSTSLAII
jgi:hypothetical protein